jgi:RHS repeat-associated protein
MNGLEATRLVYLPYGETASDHSSGSDVVTRKFTGQELDEETGLYNYGARYYDPALGRFLSADSIVPSLADGQSFNRYSYVRDNPIVYVDPTGHFFEYIGNKIQQAADWLGAKITAGMTAFGRFVGKAYEYGWQMVKGMAHDPMTALALTLALVSGNVLMFVKATLMAIAATSIAMAAGVRNPVVLSLIAAAAGSVGAGAKTGIEFLRSGASWAASQILDAAVPGNDRVMQFMTSTAAMLLANDLLAPSRSTKWVPVPNGSGGWVWADPVYKWTIAGGGFLPPVVSSAGIPGLEAYTYLVWDDHGNMGIYSDVSARLGAGVSADITVLAGGQVMGKLDNILQLPAAFTRDVTIGILPLIGFTFGNGGLSIGPGIGASIYQTNSIQNGLIVIRRGSE